MAERPTGSSASGAGLADPDDYRANCGVGVVMDLDGGASHGTVADGIELLENLEHRGTTGAEAATGDGAGILLQTPHEFFAEELPADVDCTSAGAPSRTPSRSATRPEPGASTSARSTARPSSTRAC